MAAYQMAKESRIQISINSLLDEPRPIYIRTPSGELLAIRFQCFGQARYFLMEIVDKEPD